MRCGRCGSENNAGNRFCGMCGAELVARTPTASAATATPNAPLQRRPQQAAVSAEVDRTRQVDRAREDRAREDRAREDRNQLDQKVASRPSQETGRMVTQAPLAETATSQSEVPQPTDPQSGIAQPAAVAPSRRERIVYDPGISGPSFLGLNQPTARRTWEPAETERESANRHDSNLHSSGSVDYLLEDEEEPRRGWGKLAAVVIALALVAGFGYLRWKQGGFDWLMVNKAPAHSAEVPAGAGDSGNAPAATPPPDTANPNAAAPAGTTPDSGTAGGAATLAPGADAGNAAGSSTASTSPDSSASPTTPASVAAAQNNPQAGDSPSTPAPDTSAEKKVPDADAGENSDSGDEEAAAPAAKATPDVSRKPKVQQRKPSPVTAADPTSEAEIYIYGRGVRQDCDRGLRLLKPAAAQANTRAMISLGTLYSSGTCTPRDLPTAYRWFALALHKDPNNPNLQNQVQSLWSRMTQPERQLAIKLSH